MTARWTRTPVGYLRADGQWFLERGAQIEGPRGGLDSRRNLWLVWKRADEADVVIEDGYRYSATSLDPVRALSEVTLDARWADDDAAFIHVGDAGSYAEALGWVEVVEARR